MITITIINEYIEPILYEMWGVKQISDPSSKKLNVVLDFHDFDNRMENPKFDA